MKVKQRLQISVTVSAITVFLVILILSITLYRIRVTFEEKKIADDIVSSAFERSMFGDDYLLTASERARKQWVSKNEYIGKVLISASERFKDKRDKANVEELLKNHETIGKLFLGIVEAREEAIANPDYAAIYHETENRLSSQLAMKRYDTMEYARKLQEAGSEYLSETLQQAGWSILFVIVVVTAAVTINSWSIGRSITSRISRLRDGTAVIGEGNLDHRIDITGDDEFVDLSGAFNEMAAKLGSSYHDLENEIAERVEAQRRLAVKQQQLEDLNRTLEQRVLEEVARNREKDHLMIQQGRQAAMGEMIGNIAHQWRQPLNALGLLIQDILHAHTYGELNGDYLSRSVRDGMEIIKHMSRTIDDFRNFFRPGKEKEFFLLRGPLEKAISYVEASFRDNHISITLDAKDVGEIKGYANEYAQVVLNILNNAKDALIEREIADPRVEIRVFSEEGKSVVTITDNAGGINEDIMEKIFEPYFTTKEQGRGTGIGLYMSKTIIEKNMMGKLSVRNTGDGAEFRIEVV